MSNKPNDPAGDAPKATPPPSGDPEAPPATTERTAASEAATNRIPPAEADRIPPADAERIPPAEADRIPPADAERAAASEAAADRIPSAEADRIPPADAERIAASEDAAASAGEQKLSAPASSGLGTGTVEPQTTPEPGAGAREQPVTGNEPVTPAGPAAVTGARPAPSADPVASAAEEPASDAPAADVGSAGSSAATEASTGSSAADPAKPERGDGKRSGGLSPRQILIGVLVVLLIGVVAYGVRQLTSGPANAEVGDCVSVTETGADNRAEVDTVDCSADKASYKVAQVLEATDATCAEDGQYIEIAPAASAGDGYKLCLLPNMAEGACYKSDGGMGFVKTECTGSETIKVTKVIQGSTDLNACPDSAGISYPEPAVTYCLEPA